MLLYKGGRGQSELVRCGAAALTGNAEVVHSPAGVASRRRRHAPRGHVRLVACTHEESVLARLQIAPQRNLVHSDSYVFGSDGYFLVFLHARLAAAYSAERAHLEFPVVALLLQLDQYVIGRTRAVRNVEVEQRLAVLHMVVGSRAFQRRVPMLPPHAVREIAGSAPTRLFL